MKFASLFAVCLAAFSLGVGANPVPNEEDSSTQLEVRAPPPKINPAENYNAIKKVMEDATKSEPKVNSWYVFTVTSPLVPKDDKESKTEINKLRQELGYEHIYIVVGQITEKKDEKGKKEPVREFNGDIYDMVKTENTNDSPVQANVRRWGWDEKQGLQYIKESSKKKSEKLRKGYKSYTEDHAKYDVNTNNCKSFVDWAEGQV